MVIFLIWSSVTLFPEQIPDEISPFVQLGHLVKLSIFKNSIVDAKEKKIISNGELIKETIEETPVGSGTIISPDGLILTNYHVYQLDNLSRYDNRINRLYVRQRISNAMLVYRLADNDPLKAPVLQYLAIPVSLDQTHDTALLKIYADPKEKEIKVSNLPFIRFANPFSMKLNEIMTIIGYPSKGGDTITITEGKFLGYYRNKFFPGLDGFIKTDAAMSPGNSGGAALVKSQMVGVPTAVTHPAMAGSDMGYIHPVTWSLKALTIARQKFKFNVQELSREWIRNDYNTDETRSHIYLTGWIISSHSRRPLAAEILITRPDRSLLEIQDLHRQLQRYNQLQAIQIMNDQGLKMEEIAKNLNVKVEEIKKILETPLSSDSISPDGRQYLKGDFFYAVTRCDDRGFFIIDVPLNQKVKLYAFADGHRTLIRNFNTEDGLSQDLGKIMVFTYLTTTPIPDAQQEPNR